MNEVQKENPNDELIESAARSMSSITNEEPVSFFYKHIVAYKNDGIVDSPEIRKSIQKFLSKKNYKKHIFNHAERLIIRQVAVGIVLEYKLKQHDFHSADYGMMKIQLEFLINLLETGCPASPLPQTVNIISDSGNKMVSWSILSHEKHIKFALHLTVNIDVKSLDHLENEYELLKQKYSHIHSDSLNTLATALAQEKMMSKSNQLISFTGMALSFLTVLEKELKSIILFKETKANPKNLMWKNIIKYFTREDVMKNSNEKKEEWLNTLSGFNEIRNRAAHGEFIAYEEYNQVKKFTLQSGLLDWISEYKYNNKLI
ncbi:hypothetical protein [Bacillus sp. JJ722]|uniref:hypothetical protein n=1 Tax=Bacillus sp. JJ722 TaxID=3122973 RepID=UPI002FFEB887